MLEKLVMRELAKRLTERGNCPYDPLCSHAGGSRCLADASALSQKEEKVREIVKERSLKENQYDPDEDDAVVGGWLKPKAQWPCHKFGCLVVLLPGGKGQPQPWAVQEI